MLHLNRRKLSLGEIIYECLSNLSNCFVAILVYMNFCKHAFFEIILLNCGPHHHTAIMV